jgi:hypothetical protein
MKHINIINRIMLIAVMAISSMLGLGSCDENVDGNVFLHSFGPCPVLRGDSIKFIGVNLNQVKSIVFPDNIEVTDFTVLPDGNLEAVVPQDAIPGKMILKYNGGQVESVSGITFSEPISVTKVTPTTVSPGDVITITGDYLYNVATVTFGGNVTVKAADFVKTARKEIQVTVPKEAVTGKITISDGADFSYEYPTPIEIATATVTSLSKTDVEFGDQLIIYGTHLDLVSSLTFPGDVAGTFTCNAAGTEITTTVPAVTMSGQIALKQYSGVTVMTEAINVPTVTCTSVTPSSNLSPGDMITLTGTNFDRVTKVILPGDITLADNQFKIKDNNTTITIVLPKGTADGSVTLVQNSLISVKSPAISMKKAGNAIWTGNVTFGNWASNLEIKADQAATLFADAQAGSVITFHFTEDSSSTWWQFKLCYSDWSTIWECVKSQVNAYGCVDMTSGATEYSVTLTANDAENIKKGCAISGCFLTVTQIDLQK